MADNFQIDGLVKQRKELESLMMSNPDMERRVQKLIRQVLLAARRIIANSAKGAMRSDPRQAYKAVKSSVYRRILGGSVSLLNKRGAASGRTAYEPPHTLREGQRGGNRVKRSQRTQDIMSYSGRDRAFILRFLNAGNDNDRQAGSRSGRLHGNRGRISARRFFSDSSQQALERAAEQLGQLIDEVIKNEMK